MLSFTLRDHTQRAVMGVAWTQPRRARARARCAPVQQRLDLHAVEARAVRVARHAERFHLHDALGLRLVDVRLKVHVLRERVVEDVDGRQPRIHVQLGARRVVVHERGEEAALHALR